MNLETTRARLDSRISLRAAQLTEKETKNTMTTTANSKAQATWDQIKSGNPGNKTFFFSNADAKAVLAIAAAEYTELREKNSRLSAALTAKPPTAPAASSAPKTAPEASTPAQSRPLHGLAKAIAAAKGEKVSHAPSSPPSGLAKATAIHRAEKEAKAK